jgi:pimeloyl-ACP methyl ester carboxylesterase
MKPVRDGKAHHFPLLHAIPGPTQGRPRRRRRRLLLALLALITLIVAWTWWAEQDPSSDRQLRSQISQRLHAWFPEAMAPDDGWHGIHRRDPAASLQAAPVLLIHGLDEPGDIWDDLVPVLTQAGFTVWEFRYPNDQGIDRSTAYLAEHWLELPVDHPMVLIGHSMGGLVAREFVSRWRHPVGTGPRVEGAPVAGVILVGTPNQGSEWARLRVWLEVRDHLATKRPGQFDPLAGLRDGLGEAKIDLRPGSEFLNNLNTRPWPASVLLFIVAGRLITPPGEGLAELKAKAIAAGLAELAAELEGLDTALGEGLGDGLVSLESVRLNAVEPLVVNASHRGMIRRLFAGNAEPPAIAPILATLKRWRDLEPTNK